MAPPPHPLGPRAAILVVSCFEIWAIPAGCDRSMAQVAPEPARRAAAAPPSGGAAPERRPAGTVGRATPPGRVRAGEATRAPALPTGLRDRGIFASLDARVRWRVPSTVEARRTRVVVDKRRRLLVLEVDGAPVKAYPIALGFAPKGHKERQGDGRTPEGEYRIVEMRHQSLAAKYGARSLLLSYPSARDGRAGLARGLVTAAAQGRIEAAEKRGAIPPQDTPLGSSIRIHGGGVGRDWTLGCIAMRDPDVIELYRVVRVGTRVVIHSGAGPRPPWTDSDADGIPDGPDVLLGALKTALNRARYHEAYVRLPYPGGDVPADTGVCTDVVVRALRNAGVDLQVALRKHIRARPRSYPWITRPDANIDHRRVRNLLVWFRAHARLITPAAGRDRRTTLLPGDVVFLDTLPRAGPDHIGIVADTVGPGGWPRVVNNWTVGFRTQAMVLLPAVPVTHQFRLR